MPMRGAFAGNASARPTVSRADAAAATVPTTTSRRYLLAVLAFERRPGVAARSARSRICLPHHSLGRKCVLVDPELGHHAAGPRGAVIGQLPVVPVLEEVDVVAASGVRAGRSSRVVCGRVEEDVTRLARPQ